ncbi:MAG: SRPBCC family protein, partial [Acidimicrobiia bacterium]
RNDPDWCPNVSDVTQIEGDGVERGAKFRFEQSVTTRGRSLESDVVVEVTELDDTSIKWRVVDRFQEREIQLEVVPEGEGSRVRQTTVAAFHRPPGLARWAYPMLAKRTFKDQFERLAEVFRSS